MAPINTPNPASPGGPSNPNPGGGSPDPKVPENDPDNDGEDPPPTPKPGIPFRNDSSDPIPIWTTKNGTRIMLRTDIIAVIDDGAGPLSFIASVVPYVGEAMDLETVMNRSNSTKDRVVAGISLALNIASAGFLPNFGKTAKLADDVTPSGVGRSGLPDAGTPSGGKPRPAHPNPGQTTNPWQPDPSKPPGTPNPNMPVIVSSGTPKSGWGSWGGPTGTGGGVPPKQAPPTSPTTGGSTPKSDQPPPGKPKPTPNAPKPGAEQIKDIGSVSGKSKAEIEGALQSQGYTKVTGNNGGAIWTKPGTDGVTSAVRIDPPVTRNPALNWADEVPHVHKETVPTSKVTNGNYKQSKATRYDDAGNVSNDKAATHIPGGT